MSAGFCRNRQCGGAGCGGAAPAAAATVAAGSAEAARELGDPGISSAVMPITMHQSPAEPTRTPENNCTYAAEAIIDGQRYCARSRRGAPFALARVLVAAGMPDQPVQVMHEGLRGYMSYRSLHRMAVRTIEESGRGPVHDVRYRKYPGRENVGDGADFAAAPLGGAPKNGGRQRRAHLSSSRSWRSLNAAFAGSRSDRCAGGRGIARCGASSGRSGLGERSCLTASEG